MPIGLKGNSDGSGAIQIGGSDAISISTGLNTTFAGTVTASGTVAGTTGTLYPLVSGTAVASTSGTAIDFTGIPSWAKRITVMFNGVSTNGTSELLIQIGTSSGVETTGYLCSSSAMNGGGVGHSSYTTGYGIRSVSAANTVWGALVLTLVSGNIWVASGTVGNNIPGNAITGGTKTAASTLDRLRITTVNGTDTFDAGSINILFE